MGLRHSTSRTLAERPPDQLSGPPLVDQWVLHRDRLRLHLVCGAAWILSPSLVLIIGDRRALATVGSDLFVIVRQEWSWLRQLPRWLAGLPCEMRGVGRFNAGQKLNALFRHGLRALSCHGRHPVGRLAVAGLCFRWTADRRDGRWLVSKVPLSLHYDYAATSAGPHRLGDCPSSHKRVAPGNAFRRGGC